MHGHIRSDSQNPTHIFHKKKKKKTQKNFKTPNPKSKCMKCMKERESRSFTKWILLGIGGETLRRRDLSERRKYKLREK